jgi:acyl-phosphate glycerol 3-phosphate acyltransferase
MQNDTVSVLAAWALGSMLWGVVLGRILRRQDLRARDNPGGSGSFRQFGPVIGIAVVVLDAGKGAAAVAIARLLGASAIGQALSAVAAVAGHNWPLWFGFRGGGGLATALGSLGSLAPAETVWAVVVGLVAAAIYKLSPVYGRFPFSSLPGGAGIGLPFLIWLTWRNGNTVAFAATVLCTVAIGLRGLQMLSEGKRTEQRQSGIV